MEECFCGYNDVGDVVSQALLLTLQSFFKHLRKYIQTQKRVYLNSVRYTLRGNLFKL